MSSVCCVRSTLQVIRTMACEYGLCSLFVPGDRQIILGTKVCAFSLEILQEFFSYFLTFDTNIHLDLHL